MTTLATTKYPLTDCGTGDHTYDNAKSAFLSVPKEDKRRAYIMLGAAGVVFAVLLLSRLIWLFKPVFDLVYYATLSKIIYYIVIGALFTALVLALNRYIIKTCGVHLFKPREESITIPRALGVIAVGAATVFIASACLGFNLKVQLEMGLGVTLATALTNIAVYFYYGFHMWLGFVCATLIQHALSTLVPAKFTVPWGAVFLVTVYGLVELVFELYTTDHVYPWLYYLYTYAYAAIFVLSRRRFHVSYWASVIIMVL